MYTPKINESLIPCLYHAAQERKVPMTKLTDAFVYQGLTHEYYGPEVLSRLPDSQDVVHPQLNTSKPSTEIRFNHDVAAAHPFSSVEQLNAWYQSAHTGLMQANAISDPSGRSIRQAEVAIQHLQAAYIAASNILKPRTSTEVSVNAQLSA